MSKQFFTIKSFQGGINSKDHPRDMHEMQSQDIQGLTVKDSGEAKSPGGYNTTAIWQYRVALCHCGIRASEASGCCLLIRRCMTH